MLDTLDLFCGIGGWSLAAEAKGLHTVAACELDDWKRAQYAAHFPSVRLYKDVRELTGKRLRDDGISIDIVLGSPPCTDASAANHRGRGVEGKETGLFLEAIRLLGEIRPRGACFENSPRLRTRGIDRIIHEMERVGYACWVSVVGAIHAGAPHIRQRAWIVAADADRYGLRNQQRWGGGATRLGRAEPSNHADANSGRQSALPGYGEVGRCAGTPQAPGRRSAHDDPDRQFLAVGESLTQDDGKEHAPSPRAAHGGWSDGPAGLARHLRVGDGVSPALAADCRSAYGDAIVPKVGEAAIAGLLALIRHLEPAEAAHART